MIISRTPLRISLVGGGTDLPSFYQRHGGGAVVSTAIDKYVYVSVNKKFDGKTRVSYSRTENVDDPKDLQHDLVREALNLYNERGLEITSVSDIPGEGTGLGSSSSFTVGLLASLSGKTRSGTPWPPVMMAESAYSIEANLCGHPVGRQDQYAAAFGGFNLYSFTNGNVSVQPIVVPKDGLEHIERNLMLFWTGQSRSANEILRVQNARMRDNHPDVIAYGIAMRDIAFELKDSLERGSYRVLGKALHLNWSMKKEMSVGISNDSIDALYNRAMETGALGGKLCGAGGGGFLLFYVPINYQEKVKAALGLQQVPFKFEKEGSKVIYYG